MHKLARFAFVLAIASAAARCGSSSSPSSPSSPMATGTPVSIVSGASSLTTSAYSPNPIAVTHGGSVTWMNNDSVTHTSTATDGTWDSGSIAPGGSFTRTFPNAGTFQYHCAIHPGMVGTVTVQ